MESRAAEGSGYTRVRGRTPKKRRRREGQNRSDAFPALVPDDDIAYIAAKVARGYHQSYWTVCLTPWWQTLLAFDALEELERIDGLLAEYDAVTAAVRPRMDADALNQDYGRAIERLRYDPDAVRIRDFRQEDLDQAVRGIMQGIQWRKTDPPVS